MSCFGLLAVLELAQLNQCHHAHPEHLQSDYNHDQAADGSFHPELGLQILELCPVCQHDEDATTSEAGSGEVRR
jgi:hypothetical protein